MNKLNFVKKAILSICTLAASMSFGISQASSTLNEYEPYIGVDFSANYVSFKNDYGKTAFEKYTGSADIHFGFYFNENIGMEIGYEYSPLRRMDSKRDPGQTVNPGAPASTTLYEGNLYYMSSQYKLHMPYVAVKFSTDICENDKTKIFALIGISPAKLKASHVITNGNMGDATKRSYSKRRIIPTLKVGVENEFANGLGMRLFANYKHLSPFKVKSGRGDSEIRMKNSFGVGAGLYYNLF